MNDNTKISVYFFDIHEVHAIWYEEKIIPDI